MVEVKGSKVLSCVFFDDVLCSYRKYEGFGLMNRCFTCREYRRFMREMAKQDEKDDNEILEIHRLQACFERGEISEEELRKRVFALDTDGDSE